MNRKIKILVLWLIILALALFLFQRLNSKPGNSRQEDYSTFLQHVEADQVAHVVIAGNLLTVTLRESDQSYTTTGALDEELFKKLSENGVLFSYGEGCQRSYWPFALGLFLLLLVVLLFFSLRKQRGSLGDVLSLGKSRARLTTENTLTFADVGGLAEAKEQFRDIIDFLRNPKRWTAAGVRLPRGVLLVGPPGCGKTLLARAVAGESDVPFFSISASEFVEMFVGVGAARVRDMFTQATKHAPSIVFIDELDAVGRRRGSGIGSGHDEREQTLNQLLVSLDGFEVNDKVVVIAATNRPDVLDKALLRPGRFDLRIKVEVPTETERLEMLKIHTGNKPIGANVSLEAVAAKTPGFTGADLENLANDAALLAVRSVRMKKDQVARISMDHFERAGKMAESRERVFNKLDSIPIESASQLSQPTGNAVARLTMTDGAVFEGHVVWADGKFVKVRSQSEDNELVLAKAQVQRIEALSGTEMAETSDPVGDQWAHRIPDLA